MHSILQTKPPVEYGRAQPPSIYRDLERFDDELNKAYKYLDENANTINNTHVLVNLLTSLGADPEMSLYEYYTFVLGRYRQVARSHNIYTAVQPGTEQTIPSFYGSVTTEYLYIVDFKYSIADIKDWAFWESLRVRDHPISSLAVPMFIGNADNWQFKEGDSVIEIDLVSIALQYREWIHKYHLQDSNPAFSIRQFLISVPLKNMLRSHMDIVSLNRMLDVLENKESDDWYSLVPTRMNDYSFIADRYYEEQVNRFSRRSYKFEFLLDNLWLLNRNDDGSPRTLWDLLEVPNMGSNRIRTALMILSRYKIFNLLLAIDSASGGGANRQHINSVRIDMRNYRSQKIFDMYKDANYYDALLYSKINIFL